MKKIKTFKSVLIVVVFLTLIFLICPARAQEADSLQSDGEVVSAATVNIYRTKIVGQDGNNITIAFDISNRENMQPGIKYAVELIQTSGENQTLVDEKVYDEVINIGENETIHKEIQYQAPQYLKGDFQIVVDSQNEKGLPLGQGMAQKTITLNGSGQFVSIDTNNCFLTVQGEQNNPYYTLDQGVDVAKTENLVLNCKIKNNFSTDQMVVAGFNTYYRTSFGKLISSDKADSMNLKAGEEKQIAIVIPKPDSPQAYNATFELLDSKNQSISNEVVIHYVVQGLSATIQDLALDKDYYQKGDNAKISFSWSASADDFPGSRAKGALLSQASLEVKMENSENSICIDPIITKNTNVEVPIKINCVNPKATVSIKDKDGKILDQAVLALKSKNVPVSVVNESPSKAKEITKSQVFAVTLVLTILLVIIIIGHYYKKKNNNNFIKTLLLFFLLATGMMFFGVNEVKADTVSWIIPNIYGDNHSARVATFEYSKDNDLYLPGGTMTVRGRAQYDNCSNATTAVKMNATINGMTQKLASHSGLGTGTGATHLYTGWKSLSFAVERVPGTYDAVFSFTGSYQNHHDEAIRCHNNPCYLKDCLDIKNINDYKACFNSLTSLGAVRKIPYQVAALLDVKKAGTGTGVVTSVERGYNSSGWVEENAIPINCGLNCSLYFNPSMNVTLTATPDSDSTFVGWSGACSGTGNCAVNMNNNQVVTAIFNKIGTTDNNLSVFVGGLGKVVSSPAGIDCHSGAGTCSALFSPGTHVSLTATPDSGSITKDWSGDCSGNIASNNPCQLIMDSNKNARANFDSTHPCTYCPDADQMCIGDSCDDHCGHITNGTKDCSSNNAWKEVAP